MPEVTITVNISWPGIPPGPLDDARPYERRVHERTALVDGLLAGLINDIKSLPVDAFSTRIRLDKVGYTV